MSIFLCAYWPPVSSLEKCLFRSFAQFLIGLFLVIELYELFIYFDVLDGHIIWKYFLPACRLAFHFVYDFPCCTGACKFDLVPFVFCLFVCFLLLFILPWETELRKHWYDLCQRILLPVFFSRHFIVSCLIFRSLSHFEFIFV